MQILSPGQTVRAESSQLDCRVLELLGAGGQGEVYRAELAGAEIALKWYFANTATARQRGLLEELVRKGPPNDRFLWPLQMASSPQVPGFGYVMQLRPPCYHSVVDLMKQRIDPSFRVLATTGFGLAHSFLQLHSKGLCYRDISFGNLFLDPATGEILVCDNDNVTIDGDTRSGILGTPRFMAPEVVRGDTLPSTQTDLFSLAVLLFYLLIVHHPLEGRLELAIHSFDLPAMTRLYGERPVFIFDPEDRSNEPVRGHHDNALDFWPIYPEFLRDLFTKSFTAGLRDPSHGRVREGEWRAAMIRLRDSIYYCSACGNENFYDSATLRDNRVATCWSCRAALPVPMRIKIGRSVVMLNHDSRLFPHHIDDQRAYDFSSPVAEVAAHPQQPGVWGLRNSSSGSWSYRAASGGVSSVVPPGRTVTLQAGLRIDFGKSEGEVR